MKKKLIAVLASACVVSLGAAMVVLPEWGSAAAEENVSAKLEACVDISDSSWVHSNGYGWSIGRYGRSSISAENLGVTLDAYSWDGTTNSLVWTGGGLTESEGGRYLYQEGEDFAVSFAAEAKEFAVVVDNFALYVNSTQLKIGYYDGRGTFGDDMQDYNPAYMIESATALVSESVELSGVVDVDAYVGTTDGVTTLVLKVEDKVISATTDHARVAGLHTAIVSRGMKVYSQKATEYVDSMYNAAASLGEDVYTGETKTAIDNAIATAEGNIWSQAALTATYVQEQISPVLTTINSLKYAGYLDACVDITDDSWVSNGCGWTLNYTWGRTFTSNGTIGVTTGTNTWDGAPHGVLWMGGGSIGGDCGTAYNGGNFALSFAAELTENGLAVVIDNYSIWITPTAIRVGHDEQAGTFGDDWTDYHATAWWMGDISTLHDRGGSDWATACWYAQETASLSGVVDIDVYVATENETTTLAVRVDDQVVVATAAHARNVGRSAAILTNGGVKIYSQKATEYIQAIDNAVAEIGPDLYTGSLKTAVDTKAAEAKEAICAEATLTASFAEAKVSEVEATIAELTSGAIIGDPNVYLALCKDISDSSWVHSNGYGWSIGRYGRSSVSAENLGVTLEAYSWDGTTNSLVWTGGGLTESEGGRYLYQEGADFAVSFAAEAKEFAVVVDNFALYVSSTQIRIGYYDGRGTFGDEMQDYNPAYMIESATALVSENVELSGIIDVSVYVGTLNDTTILIFKVEDTVIYTTTEHARIAGLHTAIVSRGMKVYSQKVWDYIKQIDSLVAEIDPALYVGELKTAVDAKAASAKEEIFAEASLTASFATAKVAEVEATIAELTAPPVVENPNEYLARCKDLSENSWIHSNGYGWSIGRYGRSSISTATLGVTLEKYTWDGTTNSLVWTGGGMSESEGGRFLYQEGEDFAVSFMSEVPAEGFVIVIDNFSLHVSPTQIRIGYYDGRGTFGDELQDYNPAYMMDSMTVIVSENVTLSGVVNVKAYVGTVDGITSLILQVEDTILSTMTNHTRVAGLHAAIMTRNAMKIYSTNVATYEAQIDDMVAGLDETIYVGEAKAAIDTKAAEAKESLFAAETLTTVDASQTLAGVLDVILEYASEAYFGNCIDIADSVWATDDVAGWSLYADTNVSFSNDMLSLVLSKYNWSTDHILYWAGGTSGEGNLYKEGDDFAIKFLANMTEDGLVVRVDNYTIYINASGINIGFSNHPGDGDTDIVDFSRTVWVSDIDILEEWGGTEGAWLSKTEAAISGMVEICVYITTSESGMTTIVVKVGDTTASTVTNVARRYLDRCIIIAGYQNVMLYSTKIAEAEQAIADSVKLLDEEIYLAYADKVDAFISASQKELWAAETFTVSYLDGKVEAVQGMVSGFVGFLNVCQNDYVESDYSEEGWTQIVAIVEQVTSGYFGCSVLEIEEYKEVAIARLDAVLTAEEETKLAEARVNAKAEIDASGGFVEADYSESNWALISGKAESYKALIEQETDEERMALLVEAFRAEAGSVPTLLDEAAVEYMAELDAYVATLSESKYTEENWQAILTICNEAKAEIPSLTDTATMEAKVVAAKAAIDAIEEIPPVVEDDSSNTGDSTSEGDSKKKSGCGSNMGWSTGIVVLMAGIVLLIARKKRFENE